MSNLAKLKKKATDLEHRKQLDKALPLYQQVVDGQGDGEEADVTLCNRVGDLFHRAGRVNEAITYWERAADMYSGRGFHSNAIAICNKVLRASPASVDVHHKLGRLYAQKGFRNDAKQHFLEYADRMQRLGDLDEAFSALKEFAELCPEHEDVRQSLAEQLIRHDRITEALEQLDLLHARYRQTGSDSEAQATLDRMHVLDPEYEPSAVLRSTNHSDDFIMLDGRRPVRSASEGGNDDLVLIGPETGTPSGSIGQLEGIEFGGEFEPPSNSRSGESLSASAFDALDDDDEDPAALGGRTPSSSDLVLDGFEATSLPHESAGPSSGEMLSPSATLQQLDSPHADFELPPLPSGDQQVPDDHESAEDHLISGSFRVVEDVPVTAEDDVRSHRSEDGDAAAELAAEAERRGHQPDVFDELGTRERQELALADLPLLETDAPYTASASESEESTELLGGADVELLELPPLDVDDGFADLADHSSEDSRSLWESPASHPRSGNVPSWRRVSDTLRSEGDLAGALRELQVALASFESTGDLVTAGQVADELIEMEPSVVEHHRRRVDIAFRGDDRVRLRFAYDALATALSSSGETAEAARVRSRIAELDAAAARGADVPQRSASAGGPAAVPITPVGSSDSQPDGLAEFVNLGDLLRADEPERTTRMVVAEQAPSGDEQADFAEMLAKFKQGLEENVDAEDFESHHDLGVAFREMGLLDEAIVEFQKALRGTGRRLRSFEALGECFVEKEQFQLAAATLRRAMQESTEDDDQLVGVWYLLGVSLDALEQREEAVKLYERVLAVDYGFRDAAERVAGTARAVT